MNVFVFDSQLDSSPIWLELAAAHEFQIHIFHTSERLVGVASPAQILVIDQSMFPHTFLSSVSAICRQNSSVPIIATGRSLGIDDAVDLMKDGVAWVFPKPLARGRISSAMPGLLHQVEHGLEINTQYKSLHARFSKLTAREKDVLNCVLAGTSNKEAAQLLNVSVRTIESRRAKVYRKLDSNNVVELVRKIDRLESLEKCLGVPPPLRGKSELTLAPHLAGQPGNRILCRSPHNLPSSTPTAEYA